MVLLRLAPANGCGVRVSFYLRLILLAIQNLYQYFDIDPGFFLRRLRRVEDYATDPYRPRLQDVLHVRRCQYWGDGNILCVRTDMLSPSYIRLTKSPFIE